MPESWSSFVGLPDLPLLYGLTIGELAAFVNAEHDVGADLTVVELEGWTASRGTTRPGSSGCRRSRRSRASRRR